jgi:hypothetical protein
VRSDDDQRSHEHLLQAPLGRQRLPRRRLPRLTSTLCGP